MLAAFYNRVDNAEAALLAPAIERLRDERRGQEQTIARLITLREEKRDRLARIESLIREIESLEAQEAGLLSASRS